MGPSYAQFIAQQADIAEKREKEELEDMLAHLVSVDYIQQCLSQWAAHVVPSSFVLNPHALSGNLRERFLARLYEHRNELKEVKARYEEDGASILPLRFVYHGTPEINLDSILSQGLLPHYRISSSEVDWFALHPAGAKVCAPSRGRKILVFLILPVRHVSSNAINWVNTGNTLTMKCATYQLPVGTIECA